MSEERQYRIYESSNKENLPQSNSDYTLNRYEYDDGFYFEKIDSKTLINNFFSKLDAQAPGEIVKKAYAGNFKQCDFCIYQNSKETYTCLFKIGNKSIPDFLIKENKSENDGNSLSCGLIIVGFIISIHFPPFFLIVIILIIIKVFLDMHSLHKSELSNSTNISTNDEFNRQYVVNALNVEDAKELEDIFSYRSICKKINSLLEKYGNINVVSNNIQIIRNGEIVEKEIKKEIQDMIEAIKETRRLFIDYPKI